MEVGWFSQGSEGTPLRQICQIYERAVRQSGPVGRRSDGKAGKGRPLCELISLLIFVKAQLHVLQGANRVFRSQVPFIGQW